MSYKRLARTKPYTGMGAVDEDSKYKYEQVSGSGTGYNTSSKQTNMQPTDINPGGTNVKLTSGGSSGATPVEVPSDTGIPTSDLPSRTGAPSDASASSSWWSNLSTPAKASVVGGGLILLAIAGSLVMKKR